MTFSFQKFFIIVVIFCCIGFLIWKEKRKRENFNQTTPRILIVIISASSKIERWNYEKKLWKQYMNSFPNIDCVFTECKENFTLEENCMESFKPGIFQKTILTLSRPEYRHYDYYIRANLSTFYIFDYLTHSLKKNIPTNIPAFGGFCTCWKGVQGTGIVMNRLAKEILIQEGKNYTNFNNSNLADDVLISKILKDNDVKQICFRFMHIWNFKNSTEENVKEIKKYMVPSIRLKTNDSTTYHNICDFLIKKYY